MRSMSRLMSLTALPLLIAAPLAAERIELGPRPAWLISQMEDSALKDALVACGDVDPQRSDFSIAHRGAPLMFPEHTRESYLAGLKMGAGVMECDVTFTKDLELVCRHAQNDLHTTTNILATDLAATCTTPFAPAAGDTEAQAECRTSEITLAEYQSLKGKMDAANAKGDTIEAYMDGTANWRTDLYTASGTLMTHKDSIALFKEHGVKFTPELKDPAVEMPFNGFTMDDYAQKMIDEYRDAGVAPADLFPQSFNLDVIKYWLENAGEYGAQAVYLVEPADTFNGMDKATWSEDFTALKEMGVTYLAPSLNMLVVAKDGKYVASDYAKAAKDAGLELITWTLERSGPLGAGGGWYFKSATEATNTDGDYFEILDTLAQGVGVKGVFSDWPATVTYYASCMEIGQ